MSQDESGDKANLRFRYDLQTLWIEYDAHGDRHKAWRDFTREATFEIYKDWPCDDGRSAPAVHGQTYRKTRW